MSLDAVVEDLRISALPLAETAALICYNAGSVAAQNVFTLNLDHVVKMRKDVMFRGAYRRAGLITQMAFRSCWPAGCRANALVALPDQT